MWYEAVVLLVLIELFLVAFMVLKKSNNLNYKEAFILVIYLQMVSIKYVKIQTPRNLSVKSTTISKNLSLRILN